MLTRYVFDPKVPGVALHNTKHWQVTVLMGGLACELLCKTRDINSDDQRTQGLALHDCYPSLFMQGDEASDFMRELEHAQETLAPGRIDSLVLSAYEDVLN